MNSFRLQFHFFSIFYSNCVHISGWTSASRDKKKVNKKKKHEILWDNFDLKWITCSALSIVTKDVTIFSQVVWNVQMFRFGEQEVYVEKSWANKIDRCQIKGIQRSHLCGNRCGKCEWNEMLLCAIFISLFGGVVWCAVHMKSIHWSSKKEIRQTESTKQIRWMAPVSLGSHPCTFIHFYLFSTECNDSYRFLFMRILCDLSMVESAILGDIWIHPFNYNQCMKYTHKLLHMFIRCHGSSEKKVDKLSAA